MIIVGGVILYVVMGLATHALCIWRYPEFYQPTEYRSGITNRDDIVFATAGAVLFWPIALMILVIRSLTSFVLRRREEAARLQVVRDEETARIAKEIDELINPKKDGK